MLTRAVSPLCWTPHSASSFPGRWTFKTQELTARMVKNKRVELERGGGGNESSQRRGSLQEITDAEIEAQLVLDQAQAEPQLNVAQPGAGLEIQRDCDSEVTGTDTAPAPSRA
eukprot:808351-Rhodomonas_salina.1